MWLNDLGHVLYEAFYEDLVGQQTPLDIGNGRTLFPETFGIFRAKDGVVDTVARGGEQVPNLEADAIYELPRDNNTVAFQGIMMNNLGEVAYAADLRIPFGLVDSFGNEQIDDDVCYFGDGLGTAETNYTILAREFDFVPGGDGEFGGFGLNALQALNDAGVTLFQASLRSVSQGSGAAAAIYTTDRLGTQRELICDTDRFPFGFTNNNAGDALYGVITNTGMPFLDLDDGAGIADTLQDGDTLASLCERTIDQIISASINGTGDYVASLLLDDGTYALVKIAGGVDTLLHSDVDTIGNVVLDINDDVYYMTGSGLGAIADVIFTPSCDYRRNTDGLWDDSDIGCGC